MRLNGNTVLITGGGSGIGLALARAFADKDNKVIVCGRNPEKLEATRLANPHIDVLVCDISRDQDQQRLVGHVTQHYPNLNILINNAGIQHNYAFSDGEDHARRIENEVNINFVAHLKLIDLMLPHLMKRPSAAIVNVTSALALVPKQDAPVYCATKAAMHNFTKTLRYQMENTSVKVFEIIPPLVDTEMTAGRGSGKISPERLTMESLRGISSDNYEIRIGKAKILFALNRLLPSVAEKIVRYG